MQIGLVGMPLSGKTTLFNLLTRSDWVTGLGAAGGVHTGNVRVPDTRIDFLTNLCQPEKTTYAQIQFKDIPGVHSGEESAKQAVKLLNEVRGADVLVQVVRAFASEEVEAAAGPADPYGELIEFGTELLLADMGSIENRVARLKEARKINKETAAQIQLLQRLLEALEQEQSVSSVALTEEERKLMGGQDFLSEKPLILAVNIDEEQLRNKSYPYQEQIRGYAAKRGIPVVEVCALSEMEISQLPEEDRGEFMADLGLLDSGIGRLARAAYESLGLISFFTVGEDEVRAWPISHGSIAQKAAGKIHSDISRGFIRAEVFHFDALQGLGSAIKVKERGLFRLEGKKYLVQDGDIISFRFNV